MDISEIERRQEYAIALRKKGYNCAQCVLMSLSDLLDIDENLAAKLTAAFGSGFAGSGEICGAISSIGIAEGIKENNSGPEAKIKVMKSTRQLLEQFKEENEGRFLCRDLKGKEGMRSCPELIRQAVAIFLKRKE